MSELNDLAKEAVNAVRVSAEKAGQLDIIFDKMGELVSVGLSEVETEFGQAVLWTVFTLAAELPGPLGEEAKEGLVSLEIYQQKQK